MRICVGPVASASARAWTGWAREMAAGLPTTPTPAGIPTDVLDDVRSYLDAWAHTAHADRHSPFRWRADVTADELVYLTNALYRFDECLAHRISTHPASIEPREGRVFHVVLVEALLFALTQEGPCQAAFAAQLRPWWPVVSGRAGTGAPPEAVLGDGRRPG